MIWEALDDPTRKSLTSTNWADGLNFVFAHGLSSYLTYSAFRKNGAVGEHWRFAHLIPREGMLRIVFRAHKNGFFAATTPEPTLPPNPPWSFSATLHSLSLELLLPGNHYFMLCKISAQKF